MTPEEAKTLCEKAHKRQWRKPRIATEKEYYKYNDKVDFDSYIIIEGNKVYFDLDCANILIAKPYSTHPIAVAEMMTTDLG